MMFGQITGTGGTGEPGFSPLQKDQQQRIRFQNTLAAARAVEVDRVEISNADASQGGTTYPSADQTAALGFNPGSDAEQSAQAQKILNRLKRVVEAYQSRPDSGLDIIR